MSNATLSTLSCPWLIVLGLFLIGCGLCVLPLVVGFVYWLWALFILFWVMFLPFEFVTCLNL
jgi:hypothetical protein